MELAQAAVGARASAREASRRAAGARTGPVDGVRTLQRAIGNRAFGRALGSRGAGATLQRYVVNDDNDPYRSQEDFLADFLPRLTERLGPELMRQVGELLAARGEELLPAIRRTLTLWLGDGRRRTLDQCVEEAARLLRGAMAGPRALGTPTFGVNPHSRNEDLQARSSDFPRTIAIDIAAQFGMGQEVVTDYVGNPTIRSGREALSGNRRLHPELGRPHPGTEVMWILSEQTGLAFGNRPANVRRPHPTLIGGVEPQAMSGGTITPRSGRIFEIRDDSGHFQPGRSGIEAALRAFGSLPVEAFHPAFRGFRPFGGEGIAPGPLAPMLTLRDDAERLAHDLRQRPQADARIPANHFARAAATARDRHTGLLDRADALLVRIDAFLERHVRHMPRDRLEVLLLLAEIRLARMHVLLASMQLALLQPEQMRPQDLAANHRAFAAAALALETFAAAADGLVDRAVVPRAPLGITS